MDTQAEDKVSVQQPDLDRVLEKISEIAKISAEGNYIYRGEPAHHEEAPYNGRVTSSLYRSFLERGQKHVNIRGVQDEILKEARDYIPGKIEDFELLATLQHYGDKTILIDFTTDYLVALFFACEREPRKPGRVILLPEVSEDKDNGYKLEKPFGTIRRADIQKSIFVIADQNSVTPDKDKVVCIPADLKKSLLYHLGKHHDISAKTIYNDLHGFIEKRRLHEEAYTEFRKGFTYYYRADAAESDAEKQKLYDDAIAHYTEAIELKPDLAEVYNNLGNAYYAKEAFNRAIEDYTAAITWNPKYAEAYYNRGNTYYAKKAFDEAIQDHTTAIALNPKYADAYNNRGNAYYEKGAFDEAIADYTAAITWNREESAKVYKNRGKAYYTKTINLTSEDAEAYKNQGFAYSRPSDFYAAILDYTKVIELEPKDAEAYYNRGKAWLNISEWPKAKVDLTKANEMDFDIIESFHNDYKSVEDFEAKTGIELPEEIAALLRRA